MNERDRFHNLALRTNNEFHWSSYKYLRNVVTLKLRKEKQRYFNEQLCETKEDSCGTWKNLKQLPKNLKQLLLGGDWGDHVRVKTDVSLP